MLTAALIIISIFLVCLKISNNSHRYWKEKGVRYVRPWPFFGYMTWSILRLKAFPHVLQSLYNTFPEQRYFGVYQFLMPSLLIRDPELIKKILIEDFEAFPEHRSMIDPEADPLWSKNLFAMKGDEKWRAMRSTLSPAFTSSKMKNMFSLMKECAQQFTNHFVKQTGTISVELKDITSRFANDIITTTAFGASCDSLENPNNEFYLNAKKVTSFGTLAVLKFFGYVLSPSLMKFFKFRFFNDNIITFYRNFIKNTINTRKEKGIVRPDMIHLFMEAQKGLLKTDEFVLDASFAAVQELYTKKLEKMNKHEITDEDIMAQTVLFYFAGFETVSLGLSYLTYELALNPEVHKKLTEEVDHVYRECKSDLTYDALLQMKYLDMVVSETLRKWPPQLVTDRRLIKPFTIEPERVWEDAIYLDAGTCCLFPIFAIHRDPKHYPEPDKFDPERFSDDNKHKIKQSTYLPFGGGPRSCLGSRFALLEMKTFIFYILTKFQIVPVQQTQNPIVLSKKLFQAVPDKGLWVGFKPRHHQRV